MWQGMLVEEKQDYSGDWCSAVNAACPLPIGRVPWDEHSLVLSGPEWSFGCTSPFRVVEGERMISGGRTRR